MIWDEKELDAHFKNAANWKWGIFYYNPGDSRLFVPKKNPKQGATINFAKPWSFLIFAGPVLLLICILLLYALKS